MKHTLAEMRPLVQTRRAQFKLSFVYFFNREIWMEKRILTLPQQSKATYLGGKISFIFIRDLWLSN
jgi:hypothetical protein